MEDNKEIKLADMAWSALWEEPAQKTGGIMIWLIAGGVLVVGVIAWIILK